MDRFIKKAVAEGLHAYGFSSHGPLNLDISWPMKRGQLADYVSNFQKLRTEWQNHIELYLGLEIDFLPGSTWWDQIGSLYRELDYVIGSIHLVDAFEDGRPWEIDGDHSLFEEGLEKIFEGNVQAAISRYYELVRWMLLLENPEILGHFDKIKIHNRGGRYFSESDDWYRAEIDKTLKVARNMGTIIEVNTRGLYTGKSLELYPSHWILERIHSMGLPITLSSDAHAPEEVSAGFEFASKILRKIGFERVSVLLGGKWTAVPFGDAGLVLPWKQDGASRTA